MSDLLLEAAAENYVERMGLLWEAQGLPRIAGRILGFLALQPEPRTLDDIVVALGVSKGSVSTDARRLDRLGLVILTSRPGDRRDYYVIAPDLPARITAIKLAELEQFESALDAARNVPGTDPNVRRRLDTFSEFHRRVARLLRELLETPSSTDSPNQIAKKAKQK